MYPSFVLLLGLSALAVSLPHPLQRQSSDMNSAILTIGESSFTLSAPDGWVLDDTSGRSQGLVAVFYPKGSSWNHGTAVMYVNMVEKGPGKEDLTKVLESDVGDFLHASAHSTAADEPPVSTKDDKRALVKRFHDAVNHNEELVAYIDGPSGVVLIVLSSRNQEELEKSKAAFRSLVSSYFFLSNKTVVQPKSN